MTYLYLLNFAMYQVIGLALLLVWRGNRNQMFARNMGCSTLCASLVSVGYLMYSDGQAPFDALGMMVLAAGSVLNLLFLSYGVVQLAGRELPRSAAAGMALIAPCWWTASPL